jgi:methylmalonyl-CoA mutase cobalamin-binding subunit
LVRQNSHNLSSTHIFNTATVFAPHFKIRRNIRRLAAIQERVTTVLLSIPKEAFTDSFQKLYERCQQCVVKDGDYFEGK